MISITLSHRMRLICKHFSVLFTVPFVSHIHKRIKCKQFLQWLWILNVSQNEKDPLHNRLSFVWAQNSDKVLFIDMTWFCRVPVSRFITISIAHDVCVKGSSWLHCFHNAQSGGGQRKRMLRLQFWHLSNIQQFLIDPYRDFVNYKLLFDGTCSVE